MRLLGLLSRSEGVLELRQSFVRPRNVFLCLLHSKLVGESSNEIEIGCVFSRAIIELSVGSRPRSREWALLGTIVERL